ncbi:MAG: hypothetical protein IJ806_02005 [Ruminococcus sp.]|nr:hypothetical protein [Ruminococcus sp.]
MRIEEIVTTDRARTTQSILMRASVRSYFEALKGLCRSHEDRRKLREAQKDLDEFLHHISPRRLYSHDGKKAVYNEDITVGEVLITGDYLFCRKAEDTIPGDLYSTMDAISERVIKDLLLIPFSTLSYIKEK